MTDHGADKSIFLGWDGPILLRACAWLRERYEKDGVCDLGNVIAVLPGARAGRRLLELLVGPGGVVIPPAIVTAGKLPQLLFTPTQSAAVALQSPVSVDHGADPCLRWPVRGRLPGWSVSAGVRTSNGRIP